MNDYVHEGDNSDHQQEQSTTELKSLDSGQELNTEIFYHRASFAVNMTHIAKNVTTFTSPSGQNLLRCT